MLRLGAGETVVFQAAHGGGAHRPLGDGRLRVRSHETGDGDDGGATPDASPDTEQRRCATSTRRSARGSSRCRRRWPPMP
jgi:hypothetical protein